MCHNELFVWTEGYLTYYALLLLSTTVSKVHLRTWQRTLSFDSAVDMLMLPHNVFHHLEMYLCLPPTVQDSISTGIKAFLHL